MRKETKQLKPYLVEVHGKSPTSLDNAIRELKELLKQGKVKQSYLEHCEFKRKGQRRHEEHNLAILRAKHRRLKEVA